MSAVDDLVRSTLPLTLDDGGSVPAGSRAGSNELFSGKTELNEGLELINLEPEVQDAIKKVS